MGRIHTAGGFASIRAQMVVEARRQPKDPAVLPIAAAFVLMLSLPAGFRPASAMIWCVVFIAW